MNGLTTHVLDTCRGQPAAGVRIELFDLAGGKRSLVCTRISNQDGRTDSPLLSETEFRAGQWELLFHVGDYFGAAADERFLDVIPIRFATQAQRHYHVPLLVTPWSYSTYRGS